MPRRLIVLLGASLLLLGSAGIRAAEPRTWRDSTEKHSIEATLVKQSGDVVELRTTTGRIITIPQEKLSAADREYLGTLQIGNPFVEPDAFGGGMPSVPGLVAINCAMGAEQRFSPGVIFLTQEGTAYVHSTPQRFLVDGNWVEPDEVTILKETPDGAVRVAAKRLITFTNQQVTIYTAPAAQLPPAPVAGTLPDKLPATLHVAGIRIDPNAVPQVYERVNMAATLLVVQRDKDGLPLALSGRAEGMQHVNNALLLDDKNRVIGLIPTGYPEPPGSGGADRWRFQATPFSQLGDRLRPAIAGNCQAVPVAGDRQQTEYEFIIYVSDPLRRLRKPLLKVYGGEDTALTAAGPSAAFLRDKPVEVPVKVGEPSEAALPYVLDHKAWAKNAAVCIGRMTRKHGGQLLPHAFTIQLVDHDQGGKQVPVGWFTARFEFANRLGENRKLPEIPGVDGRPMDMPRPVKSPRGGWLLTSDATRLTNQPETRRTQAFPAAEVGGTKLAGEVKTVGDRYGLVQLMLDNTSEQGHRGHGPAVFSQDGAWLYFVDKGNCLYKISTTSFKAERTLKLNAVCGQISLSKAGLVVPLQLANAVWVIDPETLAVRREIESPGLRLAVGAPGSDIGFLVRIPRDKTFHTEFIELNMVDLSTGVPIHAVKNMYQTPAKRLMLEVEGKKLFHDDYVLCMRMTVDGKYLFLADREITRFRVDGTDLVFEEKSPGLANGHTTHIALSGDGKWVAMPTGGGSCDNYGMKVLDAMNLAKSHLCLAIGAYPSAIAFDPPTQAMFASNSSTIITFGPGGGKITEFSPGDRDLGAMLMHPRGGRFVIFGTSKVYYCDTLEDRLRDDLILAGK